MFVNQLSRWISGVAFNLSWRVRQGPGHPASQTVTVVFLMGISIAARKPESSFCRRRKLRTGPSGVEGAGIGLSQILPITGGWKVTD